MISAFFEETMAPAPRLSLRVPGSTSGVRRAIDALDAFVARHGIVLRAPWQVRLALDETLSNIVKHAYRGRTRDIIQVTFAVVGGEFQVTIADSGPAYDPLKAPAPDIEAPLEARSPGGLGVYLVRKLMDRVEYRRAGGRNRLVLGRRLSTRRGAGTRKLRQSS